MKSLSQAATIIAVLVLFGFGFYFYTRTTPDVTGNDIVGPAQVIASIGEKKAALGVSVTPEELLEDSRCPVGVNCIWAGTVKIRAKMVSGLGTANQAFELGMPITTEAHEVTLIAVSPVKREGVDVPAGDYRFTFEMKRRSPSSE